MKKRSAVRLRVAGWDRWASRSIEIAAADRDRFSRAEVIVRDDQTNLATVRLELPNQIVEPIEFEITAATSFRELAELLLAARDAAAAHGLLKGLER